MSDLVAATEAAVVAADHLTDADAGAIEAMRALARKIDAWDQIVEWALEDAEDDGSRPRVPQNDNVSISAYLKYCESLGLTPSGRSTLSKNAGEKPAKPKSKLASVSDIPRPA